MSRMARVSHALSAIVLATACTHNVMPKITPAKVPSVQPRIEARAVLLLSPSFETYGVQESNGIHKWRYHMGEAAAAALSDLVSQSFTSGETRRVSDAELLRLLSSPADSTTTDVLLVPRFEEGGQSDRFFDTAADARVRLDARTVPGNHTYSWLAAGHTARVLTSRKGLTGNTLEQVLRALSDSLSANRAELEPARIVTRE